MTVSGRYYLIRTPLDRARPLTARHCNGAKRANKRVAIDYAKSLAVGFRKQTPVRNRRISVYTVDPGKRPTLLFQCHASRTSDKIVSEVL
jgi:hypothetical protein